MSCDSCPQRVDAAEIGDRLTQNVKYGDGIDYCAARGIPLGRPTMDATQITEVKALLHENCPNKGDRNPPFKLKTRAGKVGTVPVYIAPRYYKEDSDSMGDPVDVDPGTCLKCTYYAHPSEVKSRFGWGMGLCLAKGDLIPPNRLSFEAKACNIGRIDRYKMTSQALTFEDLNLFPVYGAATEVVPEGVAKATIKAQPDPSTYVSDRPVTDDEKADGILAWRELTHPKHGRKFPSVWLPIYDREWDGWTADEKNKIPVTGDRQHPELYVDHHSLMYYIGADYTNGMNPLLNGPAGTGKSEFFRYMAWLSQVPFDRIAISSATEVADVFGKHLVKVDEASGEAVTYWVPGLLMANWARPGVVVVDEPNLGQKEVMEELRQLADTGLIVNKWDQNQRIAPHTHRYLGFCMNPSWDIRYVGTNDMNEADLNRVTSKTVDFPEPMVERDIMINACNARGYAIHNEVIDAIQKLTEDLRVATDPVNGTLSFSWGLRIMIALAISTQYKTLEEAVASAVADRLDPDERSQVMGFVKSISTGTF